MSDSTQFGPYETKQLLASGRQAQVWLAEDPLGNIVALKVARTDKQRAALMREATILKKAPHPVLATLEGADVSGNWLALEQVKGVLFDEWARKASIEALCFATEQLLSVLEHLHGTSIIHGDLKPGNVLVDANGQPRLLDLGVASRKGKATKGFKGTLGFAPPERLRGSPVEEGTDYYGLGATLYAGLTGRPPFTAPDPAALAYLPLVSLPEPPSSLRPEIPQALDHMVLRMLGRDPKRRLKDPAEIRSILQEVRTGKPGRPVIGMVTPRDELRRAVVGAADGETRVVNVYGPPGSGRRTLIAEAVEFARREGLPYTKVAEPETLGAQLKSKPAVVVLRNSGRQVVQQCMALMKNYTPGLVLLHSERPSPELARAGAVEVTPTPLTLDEARSLVGFYGANPRQTDDWWTESMGLPVSLLAIMRRATAEAQGQRPDPNHLPAEGRKILKRIGSKTVRVTDLAKNLGWTEHTLLDHCEPLFAGGFLEPAHGGIAVRAIQES